MTTKTKKVKASGRFGARYGRSVRSKLAKVETKQRARQRCPFCEKLGVKRIASGIWNCKKCNKKFANNAYFLE